MIALLKKDYFSPRVKIVLSYIPSAVFPAIIFPAIFLNSESVPSTVEIKMSGKVGLKKSSQPCEKHWATKLS